MWGYKIKYNIGLSQRHGTEIDLSCYEMVRKL